MFYFMKRTPRREPIITEIDQIEVRELRRSPFDDEEAKSTKIVRRASLLVAKPPLDETPPSPPSIKP